MKEEIFFYHILFAIKKKKSMIDFYVYKKSMCLSLRGILLLKVETFVNLKEVR